MPYYPSPQQSAIVAPHAPLVEDHQSSVLDDNPRFDRRISIQCTGITLLEALETLSNAGEITFTLRTNDPEIANRQVCILLHNVPLKDALNGLSALFSYKTDYSYWRISTVEDKPRYELVVARNQDRTLSAVREEIEKGFRADVQKLKKAMNASPAQREAIIKKDPTTAWIYDGASDSVERRLAGLSAFFQGLTQEQQDAALAGDWVSVQGSSSATVASFLKREVQTGSVPDTLRFYINRGSGHLTPRLDILVDGSGYNYIGGPAVENIWRDHLLALWLTRYDTANHVLEDSTIATPNMPRESKSKENRDGLALLFQGIFTSSPLPIIALLPERSQQRIIVPNAFGHSLKTILDQIQLLPWSMNHKWRSDILLLRDASDPFTYRQDKPTTPAPVLPSP